MLTSQDRLDIIDLIHRYAELIDERRTDDLATLFTESCEFRTFDGDKGVARSHGEIRRLSARLLGSFTRTSHHVSNIRVVDDGEDHARAVTYLLAWHAFPDDRPDGILWGRYHDRLVRQEGRWLIAERTLRVTAEQDFAFKWLPPAPAGLD